MAAILKIEKRPYFHNRFTDLRNIWHGATFLLSKGYRHLSELRDSPPTSALKRGATRYRLIGNNMFDLEWHEMA